MKRILTFIVFWTVGKTAAQPLLVLPEHAQPGKAYTQCLVYDSLHVKENTEAMIPPLGWETFLLESMPKHQRFDVELPVFDTLKLKIPVDPTTHMAMLPDEYGLTTERILIQTATARWVVSKLRKDCAMTHPSNCLHLAFIEVPSIYKTVQKRVLIATAHQQRYDDLDTIVFKQVIENKALIKTAIEVPPQYEKIFRPTNPSAKYSDWRELICCGFINTQVRQVQLALRKRGYYSGPFEDVMDAATKNALTRFQKDKKLNAGTLDSATLKALDIEED
jgi:hypothetical protein